MVSGAGSVSQSSNALRQGGRNVRQGHQTGMKSGENISITHGENISITHGIVENQFDCKNNECRRQKKNECRD